MLESEITICNSFIQNRLNEGTDQKSICPLYFLDTLCCRSNYKALPLAAEVSVQPWRWRKFYLLWQQQDQHHTLCRDMEQQGDVPCQLRLCKTGARTAAGWMKDFHIQGGFLTVPTKKKSKCKNKPKYTNCSHGNSSEMSKYGKNLNFVAITHW